MKRLLIAILLISTCILSFAQKKVAIMPVVDKENAFTGGQKLMIRGILTDVITDLQGYEGYDRVNLASIMDEQKFQRSGYVSDAEIKQIGVMTGCQYVLVVTMDKFDAQNTIFNGQIIDAETAKIEQSGTADGQSNIEGYKKACGNLVRRLLKVSLSEVGNKQGSYINGHEYVDLGLPSKLKWAACNIGANRPEEYGDHFAWGETEPKNNYSESTSYWSDKDLDHRINLSSQYDAASANWGSKWRMPTLDEIQELVNNCYCSEISIINGFKCFKLTSKINGNSIIMPAAGESRGINSPHRGACTTYWGATPNGGRMGNASGLAIDFDGHLFSCYKWIYIGCNVRPVTNF